VNTFYTLQALKQTQSTDVSTITQKATIQTNHSHKHLWMYVQNSQHKTKEHKLCDTASK